MRRLFTPLPLLLLPLLSPSCTHEEATLPGAVAVQPIPVVTLAGEGVETAPPSEVELKLAALSHAERVMLAQALINTQNWGSWSQHAPLQERFWESDAASPRTNELIIQRLRLPADASPALHELIKLQLQQPEENWTDFLPFVSIVTDDYLPEHPEDKKAWQFLSFMLYMSDGEYIYSTTVCKGLKANGLDQHPEGQRILHREQYFHGCGQPGCPLCAEG